MIELNSTRDSVPKLILDLLPAQPSCRVRGFSNSYIGTLATRVKSGLTASVVLPESNSVYALTPFIVVYAARHNCSPSFLSGHIIVPMGQRILERYARVGSGASVIARIVTCVRSLLHLIIVLV